MDFSLVKENYLNGIANLNQSEKLEVLNLNLLTLIKNNNNNA